MTQASLGRSRGLGPRCPPRLVLLVRSAPSAARNYAARLAVFKIASGIWQPEAVICVVGCLAGSSCQDHPVHIPRGGQILFDPSFTSWRSRLACSAGASVMLGRDSLSLSARVWALGCTVGCTIRDVPTC